MVSFQLRPFYYQSLTELTSAGILFALMLSATLIAVLRNVIGVTTYGVFGPAILSLTFLTLGLVWGSLVLITAMCTGIIVRLALESLRIQSTHRMAILVITVSATILIFGIALNSLSLNYSILEGLFPVLVASWLVERFVRNWLEKKRREALRTLSLTWATILASYLLISNPVLLDTLAVTPEAWILLAGLNIFLGSIVRTRLSEFLRFKNIRPSGHLGLGDVLTMNVRNREVIARHNPVEFSGRVTKIALKNTLLEYGIPVAKTIAIVENYEDLKGLKMFLLGLPNEEGFVIKPNNSFGGRGILLVNNRSGDWLITRKGDLITYNEIERHIMSILDGEHSRGLNFDKAIIETLLYPHPELAAISYRGLPDIRVIVYKTVPIMAMIRLPTKDSNGRANLHQGAIGAGVELRTGRIFHAIHNRRSIDYHPDLEVKLIGRTIPLWEKILEMASLSQRAVKLGYAGVDLTIDAKIGVVVLEVNRRPGLEIQNANMAMLMDKMKFVEKRLGKEDKISIQKSIDIAGQMQ